MRSASTPARPESKTQGTNRAAAANATHFADPVWSKIATVIATVPKVCPIACNEYATISHRNSRARSADRKLGRATAGPRFNAGGPQAATNGLHCGEPLGCRRIVEADARFSGAGRHDVDAIAVLQGEGQVMSG
jgi:hypothetical protein